MYVVVWAWVGMRRYMDWWVSSWRCYSVLCCSPMLRQVGMLLARTFPFVAFAFLLSYTEHSAWQNSNKNGN